MQNPLQYSDQLKKEADQILDKSQILKILEKYGDVNIIGSYSLDVMYRPDIDILVFSDNHSYEMAKAITHEIIDTDYFNEVCFVDRVKDYVKKPQGYYLQPHKLLNGHNWKFDIWLTTRDNFDDRNDIIKRRFHEAQDIDDLRSKIISIKAHFQTGEKYKGMIDGNKIYNAVLDNQEVDLEKLIRIIENKYLPTQ